MHFNAIWYAQGLRWIASLVESAAARLESGTHEAGDCPDPSSVDEVRLRVHLRGL